MRLKEKLIWKPTQKTTYQREDDKGNIPKYAIKDKFGQYKRGEYDTYLVCPPNKLIMIIQNEKNGREYSEDIMLYIRDYKVGHPGLKFRMSKNAREMLESMIIERLADGRIFAKDIPNKEGAYCIYGMYDLVEDFFSKR